jgi:uncharacterized protein with ATP-grasp and redox domains
VSRGKVKGVHTYLGCYPCFARQALTAVQQTGADEATQQSVVMETLALLQRQPPGVSPSEITCAIHRLVREHTSHTDPDHGLRNAGIRAGLAMYRELRARVDGSEDPLATALRLTVVEVPVAPGEPDSPIDLSAAVDAALAAPIAIDHTAALRAALRGVDEVLLIAGSAPQTVFDRLLVEVLQVPVVYAVKTEAVHDDATEEDALACGLGLRATVVDTGSDVPGFVLNTCSARFRARFETARLVIAKGQPNFEALSDAGTRVFSVMRVACPVVGRDIGVQVGDLVVRKATPRRGANTPAPVHPHGVRGTGVVPGPRAAGR